MPISINFLANTRAVEKGAENIARGLEEVSDSLDDVARDAQKTDRKLDDVSDTLTDVGREAKRTGDKLGTEIKDGAKVAEASTERLERSFEELAREAKTKSKQAGDALGDNVQRGTREANEGVKEFRSEATANFSEVASSFTGSMDSAVDLVQGTLGGLAGSIPGIGIGLAALGAIGGAFYNQWKESSEKTAERISGMYEDMADSGNQYLSQDFVNQSLKEILDDKGSYEQIIQMSKDLGVSQEDVAIAFVRTGKERTLVMDKAEKELERQLELNTRDASGKTIAGQAASIAAGKYGQYVDKMKSLSGEYDDAQEKADLYKDATERVAGGYDTAAAAAQAAADAEQAYLDSDEAKLEKRAQHVEDYADSIVEELGEAGEAYDEFKDKETGALDLEAYNANIEARIQAMANYQANLSTVSQGINAEALAYIESLGADAAPLLQAYADAPLDQQQRTAANWAALGSAASDEYKRKLAAGIPSQVAETSVAVTADTTAYDAAIAEIRNRAASAVVQVVAQLDEAFGEVVR